MPKPLCFSNRKLLPTPRLERLKSNQVHKRLLRQLTMACFYSFNHSTLSIVLSVFFLLTTQAAPSSQLSPAKPLFDGATIVSSSGVFVLGFFSPGNSTKRYVGIWYHFSPSAVIWVANRNSPVLDTSGSLLIAGDGNLVVLDGRKTILWSSKVTSLKSNQSTAELFDDGNFMLNNSNAMVWQSFDEPCDTYLPGMKIGLDLVTNVNQMFTAWRSDDDPAPGNFSLGISPDLSTQLFIWEGSRPRWRSGRWNGQFFVGIENMTPTYIYGFKLSNFQQEKKMYFYYTQFNITHRYVIMPDGVARHLVWDSGSKDWQELWGRPITQCEIYNRCGNNAICTDSADVNSPMCDCLKGFEFGVWDLSGRCVRRTPLRCERKNVSAAAGGGELDRFYLIEGVKLPDLSNWDSRPSTDSECKKTCSTNCSCKAYSFVKGIGCLMWGGDLVDIHLFAGGGNDLYLRLDGSEFDDHAKGLKGYFIVIIVLAVVFLFLGVFFLQWRYRSKVEVFCRRNLKRQESLMDESISVGGLSMGFSAVVDMHEQGKGKHNVRLFGFQTIEEATGNFCSSSLLGEGGFGPVYKGILPDGQEIAVKRLSRSSGQGMEEFKNEVILIAKLQHRNLVRLLGYCIRREDKMLVYEYMPNKSLDALLFADTSRKLQLDWKTRYNIIEGVARGLVYLHRDSRLRIIHRDLKASNILLDENMNPKISDFGMARIFGSDGNETSTKKVVGTYGYMSPEYAMNGLFSVKSDVYGFGVLLIEIVSGIKISTYYNSEVSLNLLGYAWKLWNEDNVLELVDSSVRSSCSILEVSKCINVGLLCIQDRANDRPTMSSVIVMLESHNSVHQMPRQPKFAVEMNRSETDSPLDRKIVDSGNASITMLSGR